MSKIHLESGAQAVVDAYADTPPFYTFDIQELRAAAEKLQPENVAAPAMNIEDKILPVGPSGSVLVRVVRPKDVNGILPAIVFLHGGGWVFGNATTYDRVIRDIAHGTQAAVVFVEYSRAPEAQYPVAVEESYAAAKWIAENGQQLELDEKRLAIIGDSSGGNIAAAVTILAKERGGPKFVQQVLLYPATDDSFATGSYEQFQEGYKLTRSAARRYWDIYCPHETDRAQPTACPLRATKEQLTGLPQALIITAEADVLRDEGEEYARKLLEAGVKVTAVRFLGTIHGFAISNALRETQGAKAAFGLAIETLKRGLVQRDCEEKT
ncbi:lipase [Jimgerdemannia flammicorona]|uniref:Lipase n=1 Tax=Jimgerdemannia flammicorona TaxID=994334 RepID=A0A433PG94_9FUNG|nr:lipase [Jimgerdemannia flammicorona]